MITDEQEKRIKQIGDRIKDLRIRSGYTSYETFATDHDLPRKNYWRLEKGYNFTIATLLRILEIHKMTLSEFFKDLK